MTRHSDTDAELAALYARVPAMKDCRGLCWVSCGPADMSDRERQRIRGRGIRITPSDVARGEEGFFCEALTREGRCAVYDIRPMACRLWGVTEDMPCPYGCQPERWLPEGEGFELAMLAIAAGGGLTPANAERMIGDYRADRGGVRALWSRLSAAGRAGVARRVREHGQVLPPQVASRPRR